MQSLPFNRNKNPNVQKVYDEFVKRRQGLIKALTNDVEDFIKLCKPDGPNVCLYGLPNGRWEVKLPAKAPHLLPEPAAGINFSIAGMKRDEWLKHVAVRSDAWVVSVAHFGGTKFGFNESDWTDLFTLINNMRSIPEVLMGRLANRVSDVPVTTCPEFETPPAATATSRGIAKSKPISKSGKSSQGPSKRLKLG